MGTNAVTPCSSEAERAPTNSIEAIGRLAMIQLALYLSESARGFQSRSRSFFVVSCLPKASAVGSR